MPSKGRIDPEEIRSARHALKMTQTQLAAALGIPVKSLRQWEQGQQACANPTLLRIALRCLKEHRATEQ